MLNPDSRRLFLDALRPIDGYDLDLAVATTYSLDLTAMLLAPLAFARLDGYRRQAEPGQSSVDSVDPFALLKAIRGYAERTTVFCQSGRISVPRAYQRLYTYLEQSVVQVTPPNEIGVFHPKVWALRMTHPEGDVAYRLLILSRNLTFDSSWDTALVLDGYLDPERTRAIAANHPLGDFFTTLPGLAVGPIPAGAKAAAQRVGDELRRVQFELPDEFDGYAFHPIGIPGHEGMPFEDDRWDGRVVISPFVTDGALERLPGGGGTLVSRLEELESLKPETLDLFEEVFVLADGVEQVESEDAELDAPAHELAPPPNGLHAKLFVCDEGWDAWTWSGSANASTAAFESNIEFLAALSGKKSKVGTGVLLDSLSSILAPYSGKGKVSEEPSEEKRLQEAVRRLRASMAKVAWRAVVTPGPTGNHQVRLRASSPFDLPAGASLSACPITLPEAWAQSVTPGARVDAFDFPECAFDSLTAFFAFSLTLRLGDSEATETFVVHAPLEGAPENRLARVLESMLSDPAKVLRFLRLLLASDAFDVLDALRDDVETGLAGRTGRHSHRTEAPLLESMLRALAREPERLDSVAQVVRDLSQLEGGLGRLPAGFLEAWEPIRSARELIGGKKP